MRRISHKISKVASLIAGIAILGQSICGCSIIDSLRTTNQSEAISESTVIETTIPTTEATTIETTVETEPIMSYEELCSYFVIRVASNLLMRDVESDEFSSITDDFSNGLIDASDVAMQIINSDEFINQNLTNDEFLTRFNDSFLESSLDSSVLEFLSAELDAGVPVTYVADGLLKSDQYQNFCMTYGFSSQNDSNGIDIPYLYEVLSNIPETTDETLVSFGGYLPSADILQELEEEWEEFGIHYYHVGFIIIDLNTGMGLSYDLDRQYYSASSIKGPYALSFADLNPDSAVNFEGTIESMLVYSDNDAYTTLQNIYHREYIMQWCEECGADPEVNRYKYPHISTRDMTRLWVHGYEYINNNELGAVIGSYLDHPDYSLIYSELGEMYLTQSKAGWMSDDDPNHTTTVDGGIVYSDSGPYVVVIESTVPSTIEPLRPLMQTLNRVHDEMTGSI